MRISDWSSDVCSSDLQRLDPGRDMKRLQAGERCDAARRYPSQKLARCARIGPARMGIADGDGEELEEAQPRPLIGRREDRKSVVTGQSVSVRVDPGGGRILKKKNKKTREQDPA